jgi:hypothetical protein
MPITLGILAQSRQEAAGATFQLLESQVLGSTTASVTFSGLAAYASTYKHLQLRHVGRTNRALTIDVVAMQFNADTASNYSLHRLTGNGSSVASAGNASQGNFFVGLIAGGNAGADQFGAGVIDILDPFVTTKNTTVRTLTGTTSEINLYSGAWYNTAALTQIRLFPAASDSFVSGSRFSLYGVKATA